jgi:protein-disulfide isomerase
VKSAETKDKISKIIAAAEGYNVASTPTFLLNGVKIEGALPIDQLSIILDEIIRRSGK